MMRRLRGAWRGFWRDAAWRSGAHRRWFGFCAACLALYAAYACFLGRSGLFLTPADTAAALAWYALLAAGLYGLFLYGCKRLAARAPKPIKAAPERWFFWASAGLSLAILGCAFAACYPGGVTYDAANQWQQAHSGEYNNWHPVFHTLCVWLATRVWDSYPFVAVMQIAAFSLAMAWLARCVRGLGAPAWLVLLAQATSVASPLVRGTLMTVGKDGAMCVGALVLLGQAVRMIATRGEWLRRPANAALLGLALAFTTMARHNAALFTAPLALFAVCCYPGRRKAALAALGVALACVALVQGPVYSALDIVYPRNTLEEAAGLPMAILCDQKQAAPEKLDAETNAFLSSLATDEAWRDTYRAGDYNSIKFTFPRERIAKLPAQKLLRMAVAAVRADPRAAFVTVNAVTDLVWGVAGANEAVESVRNTGDIEAARYGIAKLNNLGKAALAFLDAPYAFAPVAWLFQNIGAQLLVLLLAALWALYRGGVDRLMLAAPALCYCLATMLLLCGNDARFFQFFMASAPLTVIALGYVRRV